MKSFKQYIIENRPPFKNQRRIDALVRKYAKTHGLIRTSRRDKKRPLSPTDGDNVVNHMISNQGNPSTPIDRAMAMAIITATKSKLKRNYNLALMGKNNLEMRGMGALRDGLTNRRRDRRLVQQHDKRIGKLSKTGGIARIQQNPHLYAARMNDLTNDQQN